MKCPHCGESINLVATTRPEHRLDFKLFPKDDTKITAETLGATLGQIAKALRACGNDLGVKTVTTVANISTSPEGEITVEFLVTNAAKKPRT